MNITNYIIDKAIGHILGGNFFFKIKAIVTVLSDTKLTSSEKRESAIISAQEIAGDMATFLINLAIEVAVYLLKAKQLSAK